MMRRSSVGAATVGAGTEYRAPQRIGRRTAEALPEQVRAGTVVTVVAGAGYGKTDLLKHWAQHSNVRAVSLVVEPSDAEGDGLLRRLLESLVHRLPEERVAAVHAINTDDITTAVRELMAALRTTPLLLLMDDVHRLSGTGLEIVSALIASPAQAVIVLSGRSLPSALPISRLDLQGRVVDLTSTDLDVDAASLTSRLKEPHRQLALRIHEETGGWPLAIKAVLRRAGSSSPQAIRSLLGDYLSELLADLPRDVNDFLETLAISGVHDLESLQRIRGTSDGAAIVAYLAANPIPLVDVAGDSVTLRPMLAEHLVAQVRRTNPERIGTVALSVGELLTSQGRFDEAFERAKLSCDRPSLAQFVYRQGLDASLRGHNDVIRGWLAEFSGHELDLFPALVVLHAVVAASDGDFVVLRSWLDVLASIERPDAEPWSPADRHVRLLLAEVTGLEPMGAGYAAALRAPAPWSLASRAMEALGSMAKGDLAEARAALTVMLPLTRGMPIIGGWTLATLALTHALTDNWDDGRRLLYPPPPWIEETNQSRLSMLLDAVRALYAARDGDLVGTRLLVIKAERRLDTIQVGVPLARLATYVTAAKAAAVLGEPAMVRRLARGAEELTDASPYLTQKLREVTHDSPRLLTPTQHRVLAHLAGPLPVPRIASDMHLSAATVRTHVRHIYTRLGVDNRADAVARARELGLM